MATNYPSSLDSYTTKVDEVDDVLSAHVNDLQDAVEGLESKMGVDSSSITNTIDYFLRHASGDFRNHLHDGSADDGASIPINNIVEFETVSLAQGDVLYHDGTDIVNLTAGTSGNLLRTQGAGANPIWGSAFVDRGDASNWDGSFSTINAWTELDLSAIVGAGAKAVLLRYEYDNTGGQNASLSLREFGNVNSYNMFISTLLTGEASNRIGEAWVSLDSGGSIEYFASLYLILSNYVVRGWSY